MSEEIRRPTTVFGVYRHCTRKNRYPTALVADSEALRQFHLHGVKLKVYKCAVCPGFHLTHVDSESARDWDAIAADTRRRRKEYRNTSRGERMRRGSARRR